MILQNRSVLVTVLVFTYNSEKTIIETLDSIAAQDYENIELIVTDDYSSDNTVGLCQEWLCNNIHRFHSAKIVTSLQNTGVPSNLNRGILKSEGYWIKPIAGDDVLNETAISKYVNYVDANPSCEMCVCNLHLFSTEPLDPLLILDYQSFFEKASEDFNCQKKRVLKQLVFCGPGYFYSRKLYDLVGGFDEKYLGEEWPFVIKVLYSGHQIFTIAEKLVNYRISPNSLSVRKSDPTKPDRFFKYRRMNFFEYRLPLLIRQLQFYDALTMYVDFQKQLYLYKFYETNSKGYLFLYRAYSLVDPSFYRRKVKTLFKV